MTQARQRRLAARINFERARFLQRKQDELNFVNDVEQRYKLSDFREVADNEQDFRELKDELNHE